jgi:hypothetical protein
MRMLRSILFAVLLLGLAAGCGSDPAVEVPENPAPKPEADPVPVSDSVPADSP